jgi:hypothetical protein
MGRIKRVRPSQGQQVKNVPRGRNAATGNEERNCFGGEPVNYHEKKKGC